MSRAVHSPVLRLLVTAGMLAGLVFVDAGTSLGADSRNVFFGSPSAATGTLTFTTAFAGGATATDLKFLNQGPGTLNHVRVSGGNQVPTTINPRTPAPAGPSLPPDIHFKAVYVSATSTGTASCSPTTPAAPFDGFACDINQLAAGTFVQIRVVVSTPATAGSRALWFAGQLDEGSSGQGSNADVFYAAGSFNATAATCAGVASYFLGTEGVSLANGSTTACPTQKAAISGPSFGGQGTFASLNVGPDSNPCPSGFSSCFGQLVTASVYGGAAASDAVTWTIRWSSALYKGKVKGVLHFLDGGGFDVINFTTAGKCPTPTTGVNCWTTLVSTKDFTEATFRTATNGLIRGW